MTNDNGRHNESPAPYFTPRIIVLDVLFWIILTLGLYFLIFHDWLDALVIGTSVYGIFVIHNWWKRKRDRKISSGEEEKPGG